MDFSGGIDKMSEAELLDTADALARTILEAEARLLVVAAQWAVVNGAETIVPEQAKLPGRERARRYGGVGTRRSPRSHRRSWALGSGGPPGLGSSRSPTPLT